jgi:UDP-glucose 4-epimerase
MTRFLLSLDEAVDTVFAAIRDAKRGETFIPDVPSATIMNIARALIGDRDIEIRITGVRPGEKMHEILISEEECHHVIRRGDYYSILPMLPELRDKEVGQAELSRELSSEDATVDLRSTVELLRQHSLLVGQTSFSSDEELLR